MVANSLSSDVNEIYIGYFLMDCSWYSAEAKDTAKSRRSLISKEEFQLQIDRARAQSNGVLSWAKENGYKGKPLECHWTAKPGAIQKATGIESNQKNNPTDVLTKFHDKWLGVSVKSSSTKYEVSFKNLGLGTIDRILGLDMSSQYKSAVAEIISSLRLPQSGDVRKAWIRQHPSIQEQTVSAGDKLLETFRNIYFCRISGMNQSEIRRFIVDNWTNSNARDCFPRYIKVTGIGHDTGVSARVEDPFSNYKHDSLMKDKILVEKLGDDSVGIRTDKTKVLVMRFKFESEKMASSVKMSGDPWN